MSTQVRIHTSGVDRLVERQMRNWEIARAQVPAVSVPSQQVEQFITISRAVGLSGDDVANEIAARLKWPVFDRELLQHMAGDDDVRRQLYELMDGRDLTWLESCLRAFGFAGAERDDYYHRLSTTILTLARKGHAVFLGRGADLILPRVLGLRIRLVASLPYRIERFAQQNKVDTRQAEKDIAEIERERTKFIQHHFRVEAGDPARFDIGLNAERLTPSEIADIVMAAMRVRRMIE
jgi:cytidylate kinase